MRIGVVGASGLAILLALTTAPATAAPAAPASETLFTLTDPRLDELSGLAVGRRNPGLLYAQNDSGDAARFFALDARTGQVRAVCDVPDATNHDWEDLATGPSATGQPSVWLADIGDNSRERSQVELYRVDEPAVSAGSCPVGPPQIWRLRYPDGAHDAESLIVDPTRHRAYLVTKELLGHSEVFAIPAEPAAGVQTMVDIGSIQFRLTGTAGGPNPVGELTATGASMSADGRLLAIRTYTDAYLWPVTGGDIATALTHEPTVLPLPVQPQGEGIAIDGGRLLTDSEKVGSTVSAVPIPAAVLTPPRLTVTPTPAPTRAAPATSASDQPSSAPQPETAASNNKDLLGAVALIAVLGAALALGRRRRGSRH